MEEIDVSRMACQPQDQFVEEQDQPVVAERLGVGTDDRQPNVEIDVSFVFPLCDSFEGREDVLHQIADESAPFVAGRWSFETRFKPGGVPTL